MTASPYPSHEGVKLAQGYMSSLSQVLYTWTKSEREIAAEIAKQLQVSPVGGWPIMTMLLRPGLHQQSGIG